MDSIIRIVTLKHYAKVFFSSLEWSLVVKWGVQLVQPGLWNLVVESGIHLFDYSGLFPTPPDQNKFYTFYMRLVESDSVCRKCT